MSIAVSAVVRPSICLRAALAGFGLLAGCAAGFVANGAGGVFYWPAMGSGAGIAAALILAFSAFKNSNALRIDISGVGQIRLTVYQVMRGGALRAVGSDGAQGTVVSLMAGSTLWPGLLLLRLRAGDGCVTIVPIWPDSVAAALFRPLAVACRSIAARTDGQI